MTKITNIKELHELINPKFLTTEKSCKEMLNKTYNNKCILKNYAKKVQQRLDILYKNNRNKSCKIDI